MFRALIYAIISIFAITFLRMVVGLITKGVGDLFKEEGSSAARPAGRPAPPHVPTTGEFKPCQACGTYVLTSAAIQVPGKGYFCSKDCKEKFVAAS
jgi:hypothetical protein